MASTFVIFGRPGAGKSSLINKLSGTDKANVESSKFKDGTSKVTEIHEGGNTFVDTPGLGSEDFRLLPESVRKKCGTKDVIVILVISKRDDKITTIRPLFKEILNYFNPPVFSIVWSRDADDRSQHEKDKKEAAEHFGVELCNQFDMQVPESELLDSLLRDAHTTRFKAHSHPTSTSAAVPKSSLKTPISPAAKICRSLHSNISMIENPLKQVDKNPKPAVVGEAFVALKNHPKFGKFAELGDALLRLLVYSYFDAYPVEGSNEKFVHLCSEILGNKDSDVMASFFDAHAPPEMNGIASSSYSAHTKADYVEALMIYPEQKSVQKYVLSWILREGRKRIEAAAAAADATVVGKKG